MIHPLFSNRRFILIYILAWLLIIGIHAFILSYLYDFSFGISLSDSVSFNLVLSVLGIAEWFILSFISSGKPTSSNLVINHITSMSVVLLIWVGVSNGLCKLLVDDAIYLDFLKVSLPWRVISGILLYAVLMLIYYVIIYYNNLQVRISAEAELKSLVKESELNLLKSQIRPHFLFNSLNSLNNLIATNPEDAQEMVVKLSDFLRYTVSLKDKKFAKLSEEFENINRYLDIEKTRFGDKIVYKYKVDKACQDRLIPVMILQPLYENAIKHGVYESSETITINTECSVSNDVLEICISNNFEEGTSSEKGEGMGLSNIRDRLMLLYKNEKLLKTSVNNNIFSVSLFIPN